MIFKLTGGGHTQLSRAQQELLVFCAEAQRWIVDSRHVVTVKTYQVLARKGLVEIFDRPEVLITEAGMIVGKLLLKLKEK